MAKLMSRSSWASQEKGTEWLKERMPTYVFAMIGDGAPGRFDKDNDPVPGLEKETRSTGCGCRKVRKWQRELGAVEESRFTPLVVGVEVRGNGRIVKDR